MRVPSTGAGSAQSESAQERERGREKADEASAHEGQVGGDADAQFARTRTRAGRVAEASIHVLSVSHCPDHNTRAPARGRGCACLSLSRSLAPRLEAADTPTRPTHAQMSSGLHERDNGESARIPTPTPYALTPLTSPSSPHLACRRLVPPPHLATGQGPPRKVVHHPLDPRKVSVHAPSCTVTADALTPPHPHQPRS